MKYRLTAFFLIISILYSHISMSASAYGEVSIETEVSAADTVLTLPEYQNWLSGWQAQSATATGNIILTPGADESCMNFSWYSVQTGTPAVRLSTDSNFSTYRTFTGVSMAVSRSNGTILYQTANHVSVEKYLKSGYTYYYQYTENYNSAQADWSGTFTFKCPNSTSVTAILVGDPQIGASGNISADAYNWDQTLESAVLKAPDASFLLSAGDQVNYKTDDDSLGVRESEYAGFLYPSQLRSLPMAAAIGNHETKGTDYKYHFNNPNSGDNYGATPSGCDYYFSRGNALFIVLNSNSRKITAHRKLMKKAVAAHPDSKWRIVIMHHDIYGSGTMHSNRTSANLRTIFAPLMDEYNIDVVFTGHDHSYARSYSMLDGTSIRYPGNTVTNPAGTTYFSLGTSSGSKMYGLAASKQFYVAERSNQPLPTFSILSVGKDSLTVKTYDSKGEPYADTFTIVKTKTKSNPLSTIEKAANLKKTSYTKSSYKRLTNALSNFADLFQATNTDKGATQIASYYRTAKDPLSYYGYAAGTTDALPDGFSTLLDKTRLSCISITSSAFTKSYNAVANARKKLKKTTLKVTIPKKGKKALKSGTTLTLKKGEKLRLKITATPARYKISCTSGAKKYVSINKKGIIQAKKKTASRKSSKKNTVPVTIRFQNRVIKLMVRVR